MVGFKKFRVTEGWEGQPAGAERIEHVLTFGRRGSCGCGKFLRVYDKKLESNGAIDCIRWEVEFSGERALAACGVLLGAVAGEEWAACGSLVGGAIDFRRGHNGIEKNLDRLIRYGWWAKLIECMGRCPVRVVRVKATLASSMAWLRSAAAPLLSTVREYCMEVGESGFWQQWRAGLLEDGRQRLRKRHISMIEEALAFPIEDFVQYARLG